MDPAKLELYLDGLLDDAAAAEFERELARSPALAAEVEAQAAVDGFLRRRFDRFAEPLAPAPAVPAPPRPELVASAPDAPGGPGRTGWLAAAAALLLGLALGFALSGEDERARANGVSGDGDRIVDAGAAAAAAAAVDVAGSAEPPSASTERSLVPLTVPDLGALYASLAEGKSELVAWGGPAGATLESRLAARYDECLDVSTSTCALLGPFASKEWPSAAVLVAFCEGVDGAPTLLVVDDQTMEGCGLTPRTGGLSPFYKEVNGLAVWEVTDADQPRLLDSVRSCAR